MIQVFGANFAFFITAKLCQLAALISCWNQECQFGIEDPPGFLLGRSLCTQKVPSAASHLFSADKHTSADSSAFFFSSFLTSIHLLFFLPFSPLFFHLSWSFALSSFFQFFRCQQLLYFLTPFCSWPSLLAEGNNLIRLSWSSWPSSESPFLARFSAQSHPSVICPVGSVIIAGV